MMTRPAWIDALVRLGACRAAVTWAATYPTLDEAWAACGRADWLLWLVGRTTSGTRGSAEHRALVLTACACARRAQRFAATATANLRIIDLVERWAGGDESVTLDQIREASWAATAAAWVAEEAEEAASWAAASAARAAEEAEAAAMAAALAAAAERADEHHALCALIRARHQCPVLR